MPSTPRAFSRTRSRGLNHHHFLHCVRYRHDWICDSHHHLHLPGRRGARQSFSGSTVNADDTSWGLPANVVNLLGGTNNGRVPAITNMAGHRPALGGGSHSTTSGTRVTTGSSPYRRCGANTPSRQGTSTAVTTPMRSPAESSRWPRTARVTSRSLQPPATHRLAVCGLSARQGNLGRRQSNGRPGLAADLPRRLPPGRYQADQKTDLTPASVGTSNLRARNATTARFSGIATTPGTCSRSRIGVGARWSRPSARLCRNPSG